MCPALSKTNVQELVGCEPDQSGRDYLLVMILPPVSLTTTFSWGTWDLENLLF